MRSTVSLLAVILFCTQPTNALAGKKMTYTMTVYKLILNGDTLQEAADLQLSGVMKKHTKRLPMVALDDGSVLHIEMWITKEGVAAQKFTVFQCKYYTKENELWTLMAVTPRLKFIGDHMDRGHYTYKDPQTGESLELFYQLSVVPLKKKKRKGRGVNG